MEIISTIKALPEQRVSVRNYRCHPARWEEGTVSHVKIGVDQNGKAWNQYRVLLDRRSASNNVLSVTVDDDGIKRL